MKRIWLVAGMGTLVAVVAVVLLMSGIVEAPSQKSKNQTSPEDTVAFEEIEKEVEQKEEPAVDVHDRELTIHAGAKSTGGHSIEIDRIEETEDRFIIYVIESEPGDECIVTQAITYPQATVHLSKQVKKPVEVVTERIIRDCQ